MITTCHVLRPRVSFMVFPPNFVFPPLFLTLTFEISALCFTLESVQMFPPFSLSMNMAGAWIGLHHTPLALGRYQRVAMNASDLAQEVVAFNALRDRPSRLALVVHNGYGSTCTPVLTILAPIEKGRQILRIIFPEIHARGRVTVDYARNDLEAAAVLIESKTSYGNDVITLLENMEFI